jgi:hypothetical protein
MVVPPNKKIDSFRPVLTPISELENLHLTLVKRLDNREDKEQVKELVKNLDDFKEVIDRVKNSVYDPYNMSNKDVKYMETGAGKPEYCGSCHTKQTDMTTKYCEGCQKDPWYDATTSKVIDFMTAPKMMKFGTFEADYAEFEMFREFMKFKHLSLNNKDAERRTEERKE